MKPIDLWELKKQITNGDFRIFVNNERVYLEDTFVNIKRVYLEDTISGEAIMIYEFKEGEQNG